MCPGKSGDGIRKAFLHAARLGRLAAQLNDGAYVALDDPAQGGIVIGVVFVLYRVAAALLHDACPFVTLSLVCGMDAL
jgi:hypothetical protein